MQGDGESSADLPARPPSLLALPSYLAGSVARIGNRHLVAVLDGHGLGRPHYAVLAALSDFGALAGHELAERLQGDRSHVSSYVEALARRGWVERHPDPADRRRHRVALTVQGTQVFAELAEAAEASQQAFLETLTTEERQTLAALLSKVIVANHASTDSPRTPAGRTCAFSPAGSATNTSPPTPSTATPGSGASDSSSSTRPPPTDSPPS